MIHEELAWERCPRCKSLGRIDRDQEEEKVSIVCSECGHHYYRTADKRLEDQK